jgi:hypothetical protein
MFTVWQCVPCTDLCANRQQWTKQTQVLELTNLKSNHIILCSCKTVLCAHTKSLLPVYLEIGMTFVMFPHAVVMMPPTALIIPGLYVPLVFYYPFHRSALV